MKFELNEWKTQLTDEEIIADIQKTATRLGKDYISIVNMSHMLLSLTLSEIVQAIY